MAKICDLHKKEQHRKHVHELHKTLKNKNPHYPKGVHPEYDSPATHEQGVSHAGLALRHGHKDYAKEQHKKVLADLKSGSKPNLDKAETGHEKGVHRATYGATPAKELVIGEKSLLGENMASRHPRDKNIAAHKQVLSDLRSMPKPNLHKHEEGFHKDQEESDNCPYCSDNEDDRTDDCAYCQDLDAQENADGTAGMHDCPECQEYDAANQNTGGIDDCPYCQTENITESQANPDQFNQDHECNCPNCPKNDQTGLAVEDMTADHPDDCPECQKMYGDAIENQPGQTGQEDPNLQGHETAAEVLESLDQEPGQGEQTPEQIANKIDNTEMPQGDQMEEGTSTTEDFGPEQKEEISDSEKEFGEDGHDCNCPDCPGSQESTPIDSAFPQEDVEQEQPDMADVMQGGLQDHEDEQQKQKVLDMVGQTLAGFKANKQALEEAKEQNQGLYNSCIQMLRSMIELCKLLGLEPKMPAQPSPEQAAPEAAPNQPSPPPQSQPKDNLPPKKAVG